MSGSAVNEAQGDGADNAYIQAGRALGRSRTARFLGSIIVAALFSFLAYIAWYDRDLAAAVLAICLLVYGFRLAWRLLPIPGAVRERWSREEQIAARCPAAPYRGLFWAGIGIALNDYWRADASRPLRYSDYGVAGLFIVVGLISYLVCRQFARHERSV